MLYNFYTKFADNYIPTFAKWPEIPALKTRSIIRPIIAVQQIRQRCKCSKKVRAAKISSSQQNKKKGGRKLKT
jgi:hypothetical protein